MTQQSGRPRVTAADGRRTFAHFPAAVLVYVVDDDGRLLLLSQDRVVWEVVSGALESDETVLDGALREAREELGAAARLRPLGTVHVSTVHYDSKIRDMIDIGYLFAFEGGAIEPGDDAAGSAYRWWTLAELASGKVQVSTPQGHEWLFPRAVELHRLWREQDRPLQERPPIELERL